MTPSRAQQLAIAALDHLQAVAHQAMRLVAKSRFVPVGGTDQPPAEQGGRDFKLGCLLLAAIETPKHVAKAPTLGYGQADVGNVLPMDRADEPLDRPEPVLRHVVERNDGGKRFARLSIAKKRELSAARRRSHVKADVVLLASGQRDVEGAALPCMQIRRNLDKVHDPRVDLRRPIDGLLNRGLIRPGRETANPSACAVRASP